MKYEKLYQLWSSKKVEPTEEGRKQFFEKTSFGIEPEIPDPYYLSLQDGKGWFNVQQAEVQKSYLTNEWWGWYQYWKDFKGERWVLRHLMSWHPDPPEWLFKEGDEKEAGLP